MGSSNDGAESREELPVQQAVRQCDLSGSLRVYRSLERVRLHVSIIFYRVSLRRFRSDQYAIMSRPQLRGRADPIAGQQRLHGQERVHRLSLPERWQVHQPGSAIPIPLHLPGRFLGRELRAGPGRSNAEA